MTQPNSSPYWTPTVPLIAILRGIRPNEALAHIGALVEAGFDAIEVPLNSPDWQASIKLAVEHFSTRACIGGGTVLTTSDVDTLLALGARLVVAPNTQSALIRHEVAKNLSVVPGVAAPTEAFDALEAGARALQAPR
jgi:2-dehydro-3-deoxyphosphogalactonate aldolase